MKNKASLRVNQVGKMLFWVKERFCSLFELSDKFFRACDVTWPHYMSSVAFVTGPLISQQYLHFCLILLAGVYTRGERFSQREQRRR